MDAVSGERMIPGGEGLARHSFSNGGCEKAPVTIARDRDFFLPGLEAGYRLGFGLLGLAALRGNGNVGHRSRVGSAVPVVLLSWNHHDIALGNR